MTRLVRIAVPLAILATALVFFREPVRVFAYQVAQRALPCVVPIPYALIGLDERFGVTRAEILDLLAESEALWEEAIGRDLFVVSESPVLKISFVYDDRQATTEKLNELGLVISTDLASYNELKQAYESERAAYLVIKYDFERMKDAYEADAARYDERVRSWNARGGAPRAVHDELERERDALVAREGSLERLRDTVNAEAQDVNSIASRLNKLAAELNIGAVEFNAEAGTQQEFEEAVYESAPGEQTITVYEFDDINRLRRVLTHELGHALGIEHVEDDEAIMYPINQSREVSLHPLDIEALRTACRAPLSL